MARASPASHAALIKAQQRARKAAPQGALGSPGMGSSRGELPRWHRGICPDPGLCMMGRARIGIWDSQGKGRAVSPTFGGGGGRSLQGRALWERPQGQGQLALSAHQPSLPDAACASHPCAWPLDTSLQPKGCPLSPHHSRCVCTCSSHKPSPWWQDGDGDGEHPQSPSLEGKKESCGGGKIPPYEAGTLPATPSRAVAPLHRDGGASTEHLRGGWLPLGGGWGGSCPHQSLHPSWEVQAGPWGGRGCAP